MNEYPLYSQLLKVIEQNKPLSTTTDLVVESTIFKYFKPIRVLELGAGTGNWCITMSSMSRDSSNQHYTLVDNFSWHNSEYEYNKQVALENNFPKNVTELSQHVSKHISFFDIIDKSIDSLIQTNFTEKFDIIRIDCDPIFRENWNNLIEWIDRNGSDRLILISDDISSINSPHRMLILQQLVAQNKMKLMYIGEDTAAWCRPNLWDEKRKWFDYIFSFKEINLIKINQFSLNLYGYKQDFLQIIKKLNE